jgi:two-component system CheB/CheR fusion protein
MECQPPLWRVEDAAAATDVLLTRSEQYGIVFMDAAAVITGWNLGACYVTGFDAQEALGQPISMMFTAEDRRRGLDTQELNVARTLGVCEDERWHVRRDGSRFWSTGSTFALRADDGGERGFMKVFRDATHLRIRMRTLENAVRMHEARQRERDRFLGAAVHELRNPLAPIATAAAILRATPGLGSQAARPLDILERQVGILERLVEDLVDHARIHAGKLRIDYRPTELQALLGDALENCRGRAQAKGVELLAVLPPVPLEVDVDPVRVEQVVVNLLNNAIKFTPRGGRIVLSCTADGTHFMLAVKDDGQGIEPAMLPLIFEAFTQAGPAGARRTDGLGIGLSLVKEVVSQHKGTVEARSEGRDKGSEFTVRMPLRRPDHPDHGDNAIREASPTAGDRPGDQG